MGSATIERWIMNLGGSYDSLIADGVIPCLPLQALYEDSDSLEIEPSPGLELSFWAQSKKLEMVRINLDDTPGGIPPFTGELPFQLHNVRSQNTVHQIFGAPIFSKSVRELSGTGLGGWDTYQLDPQYHSAALLDFQYDLNFHVLCVSFSLIEKHV